MSKTTAKSNTKIKLGADKSKIIPKAYTGPEKNEKVFTFKNFFIEYARFHREETNIWIHIIFIPVIVATIFGWGFYNTWLG